MRSKGLVGVRGSSDLFGRTVVSVSPEERDTRALHVQSVDLGVGDRDTVREALDVDRVGDDTGNSVSEDDVVTRAFNEDLESCCGSLRLQKDSGVDTLGSETSSSNDCVRLEFVTAVEGSVNSGTSDSEAN